MGLGGRTVRRHQRARAGSKGKALSRRVGVQARAGAVGCEAQHLGAVRARVDVPVAQHHLGDRVPVGAGAQGVVGRLKRMLIDRVGSDFEATQAKFLR